MLKVAFFLAVLQIGSFLYLQKPLAAAKARGTKLGNPRIAEARAARKNTGAYAKRTPPEILALIKSLRGQGKTLRTIAEELNRLHIRTPQGFPWHASTVNNQLRPGSASS